MAKPSRYTREEIDEYLATGQWQNTTMSRFWDRNAVEWPDRIAIEDPDKVLTWAQTLKWIDRMALSFIDLGIRRDSIVAVQLPNNVELHLLRLACEKAGLIILPVVTTMRENEMEYILNRTRAAAVVITPEFRKINYVELIRKIRPRVPTLQHVIIAGSAADDGLAEAEISIDDLIGRPSMATLDDLEARRFTYDEVSLICLTSGTTGFPKFVEYPAATCVGDGQYMASVVKMMPDDVVTSVAPAARGPNLSVYHGAPQIAARIVMVPWVGPEQALRVIAEKRSTVVCLVPAQLAMMLEKNQTLGCDLSSVRVWVSAGSILPPSLARMVEEKVGGVVLSQYGAVDFGGMAIPLPDDDFPIRMSTVGRPGFGTSVKIVDDDGREVPRGTVGGIKAKGPLCSSGYFEDAEATARVWSADGWYDTGDLGIVDERYNLIIAGRKKDMIIRGGQNIIPIEIESLLVTHPKIQDVAIVAMPDLIMGEKACAYIIPRKTEAISLEEMVAFLKEKGLAPFKIPERVEIVDRFPMVADGQKVDKKALAKTIAQKLESELDLERTKK